MGARQDCGDVSGPSWGPLGPSRVGVFSGPSWAVLEPPSAVSGSPRCGSVLGCLVPPGRVQLCRALLEVTLEPSWGGPAGYQEDDVGFRSRSGVAKACRKRLVCRRSHWLSEVIRHAALTLNRLVRNAVVRVEGESEENMQIRKQSGQPGRSERSLASKQDLGIEGERLGGVSGAEGALQRGGLM